MILLLMRKLRCHILFCEEEEVGGVGARKFTQSKLRPEVNYIVELDRRGTNDAVFYSCDNPDFTEFVCSFGFEENYGSFSDISVSRRIWILRLSISAQAISTSTASMR